MTATTSSDIWVFGDLRSRHLLDLSMKVVAKAADLARQTDGRVVLFMLTPDRSHLLTVADDDSCAVDATVEAEAFAWGADIVCLLESDRFRRPTAHRFAGTLTPVLRARAPRLVLFPLTDFGRDLAARCAAAARGGLMADCAHLRPGEDGTVVGLCPAWGGSILAEIAFADGGVTGFATVHPHGAGVEKDPSRRGRVEHVVVDEVDEPAGKRLISSRAVTPGDDDLESAHTVVVGGAGLGSMETFGLVRQLAAAVTGQVAATRPPVMNHWVAEDRLIGQTGKTVAPRLLISVGTSGAVQYTAGIMAAETIVAINRDPRAPIFQLADIGVVADAGAFLPLLIARVRQAVMRRLADDICAERPEQTGRSGFAEKIRTLRHAQGWTDEQLAQATGQTPEFIAAVEAGTLTPPVGFLLGLAKACGVDPGTFLREDEKAHIRDQRTQAYVNRTRNYSYQSLTAGAEHDHLRAFMVTIEPHHDHTPVAYKHDGEEFIFVMEGELQFTLGSKVHVLKKGESIHFHSATAHTLKSLSAEVTRCLVILYTL